MGVYQLIFLSHSRISLTYAHTTSGRLRKSVVSFGASHLSRVLIGTLMRLANCARVIPSVVIAWRRNSCWGSDVGGTLDAIRFSYHVLYWLDVVGADLIVSGEILYPQWGGLNGSIPSVSPTIDCQGAGAAHARFSSDYPPLRTVTSAPGSWCGRGINAALGRGEASGEWRLNTQTDELLASLIFWHDG